jgi:2'-5' RNA ligase
MRLFVSVGVPEGIKLKVARLQDELPKESIKPVRPENMHLTLSFLGEVSESAFPDVVSSLSSVEFSPFDVSVKGVGVFPRPSYVKVVWAGVDSPPLNDLASNVASSLSGFDGDGRFSAHLTLARVRKKIDIMPFLEKHADDDFGDFRVSSFKLMQSRLGPDGPTYSVLEEFTRGK